jgi:hypothetical protein
MKKFQVRILFAALLASFVICATVSAQLVQTSEVTLENSEQPFSRRIYSYDFDVTPDGTVHAVYSLPVPGENRTQIIYTSKQVGGAWPAEANRVILEQNGLLSSISTFLIYDSKTDTVHVCYIVGRSFVDPIGFTASSGLIYQTIKNGVPGPQINVSSGAFNTKMQLDANGNPVFAREYQIFLNPDGTLRTPPYPQALRIQTLAPGSTNQWTSTVLNLPSAVYYRLAGFAYDTVHNRYQVLYGDHNAPSLSSTYPTCNPPASSCAASVYFPPGSGHNLWYASSSDLTNWTASLVDGSGNISENEFWTDLVVDGSGTPWVSSYRYATNAQGVQEGTTNIIGSLQSNNTWTIETVAGKTAGASPSRAGAVSKLLIDSSGSFHGVWDDSPDKPIDADGADGNIMYQFSPDGKNWAVRQAIEPYSAEGECRTKIYKNKFLLMVLGDYKNTRLVFSEFVMPTPTDNLIELSTDKMFYAPGEPVTMNFRHQGSAVGDYYLLTIGPFNIDASTGLIDYISTTQFNYLGADGAWHAVANIFQSQPVVTNASLSSTDINVMSPVARLTSPFIYPSRYAFMSLFKKTGSPLSVYDFLTPNYIYYMHLCNQTGCADL